MTTPNLEQLRDYVYRFLERELALELLYHNLAHTCDDVVPAAERLADMEGLTGESRLLLLTAAWLHDVGLAYKMAGHENLSATMAGEILPGFGYHAGQIETVQAAIMATKLPQSPKSLLEEIMADADLDVLGREDFMLCNEALRQELRYFGREFTDSEWYTGQANFLRAHQYFTRSAQALRNAQKQRNLAMLQEKIAT